MKKYTHGSVVAALSFAACAFLSPSRTLAAPLQYPITTYSLTDEVFYMRLENGVSTISGADVKILGKNFKSKADPGYALGGAVGFHLNEFFSAEIEMDHTQNKTVISGDSGQGNLDFTLKQRNLITSGVLHCPLAANVAINVALGAGAQFTSTNLPSDPSEAGVPKSDVAFVGQAKTGLSIALSEKLSIDAGYKLRTVSSSKFYSLIPDGETASTTARLSSRLNHLITAGLTYCF